MNFAGRANAKGARSSEETRDDDDHQKLVRQGLILQLDSILFPFFTVLVIVVSLI